MLLFIQPLFALTLDEAVARASTVDPDVVIASLSWKSTALETTATWASRGVSPSLSASRTWAGGAVTDSGPSLSVAIDVLDVAGWFEASQQGAINRQEQESLDATRLDVQYAAAALFYSALAADAALTAAQRGEVYAKSTLEAAQARVAAGLENELTEGSARLGYLSAQATVASAEASRTIAYARLERALQMPLDPLVAPTTELSMPEGIDSPWLRAEAEAVTAAQMGHGAAIAELFPTPSLTVSSPSLGATPATSTLGPNTWALTFAGSWTFDGVIGPFVRARQGGLEVQIAQAQYEALRLDLELGLTTAREQVRVMKRLTEVARAREALAEASLQVGQARLAAGLAAPLEVLRLQDEAASARADRVQAELSAALAILEARRIAGMGWGS